MATQNMHLKTNHVSTLQPILVPRALLTRGQRSAMRGSGKIQTKPDTIKTWYLVKHCACSTFIEHAQCLTGYHVFMVSGLDFARAPRRAPLTARKKGSGYESALQPNYLTTFQPRTRDVCAYYFQRRRPGYKVDHMFTNTTGNFAEKWPCVSLHEHSLMSSWPQSRSNFCAFFCCTLSYL
jgi:hypothetical protein